MPMRTECKNFESRSYPNGDTVRKCNLDLAPDAPWRCPENCPKYERRLADVAWTHGTLSVGATPPEPGGLDDGSAAAVLDAAEDIVNAIGAEEGGSRGGTQREAEPLRPHLQTQRLTGIGGLVEITAHRLLAWCESIGNDARRRRPRGRWLLG